MKGYSRSKEDFRQILYTKYFTMPYTEKDMNSCLGIGEQQTDYLLEGFDDALPDLVKQDDIIFAYNQYNQTWSKKSCTIFSAVGAISDLYNYEFSLDEIKKIDDISYTRGRFKDDGWWVQAAVKLVADRWNEHHKNLGEVAYYRVDKYNDSTIANILDKGYTLMTSFNGNYSYIKDYDVDGVLNGTSFGNATFGHAINVRKINGKRCCKDSSKGTAHNIYELEHKLSEIGCFSSNAYLYTKVKDNVLERVKKLNEIRTRLLQGIPLNSELRHLTSVKAYQNKLHDMNNIYREWLDTIEKELKSYS